MQGWHFKIMPRPLPSKSFPLFAYHPVILYYMVYVTGKEDFNKVEINEITG
jgi:hypothetical protein